MKSFLQLLLVMMATFIVTSILMKTYPNGISFWKIFACLFISQLGSLFIFDKIWDWFHSESCAKEFPWEDECWDCNKGPEECEGKCEVAQRSSKGGSERCTT